MEPSELDSEIDELEQRVERLRSLYEQYFIGIEKLEPLTARKDVERRIWVLRREQIRNTRKRFKLQTIIQRYGTYQQYWMRINREIEAGTYRRHLVKAKKILENFDPLTAQARRRHRILLAAADGDAQRRQSDERGGDELPEIGAPDPNATSSGDLDEGFARLDELFGPSIPPPPRPPPTSQAAGAPRRSRSLPTRGQLGEIDLSFDGDDGVLQASQAPARGSSPNRSAEPPAVAERPASDTQAGPPAASPFGGTATRRGSGRPSSIPVPRVARPGAPLPRPTLSGRPLPPPPRPPPSLPAIAGPPVAVGPPPTILVMPSPPVVASPGASQERRGSLQPPPKPAKRPASPAGSLQPGARVADPRGARGAPLAPAIPSAPPPARPDPEALAEVRLRALHQRLVEARRQTRDPSAVTLEGLRKSLAATEARLRQQHGSHRRVDFEVVIKDGKAVLKPIIR